MLKGQDIELLDLSDDENSRLLVNESDSENEEITLKKTSKNTT